MSILPTEDELVADTESRDQHGGPSTGSSSCGKSRRGRRQQVGGELAVSDERASRDDIEVV